MLKQKLGERDAHLPAAGKFVGQARPVLFGEAQADQNSSDFRFDGVAVACAKLMFHAVIAVGDGAYSGLVWSSSAMLWVSDSSSCFHRAEVVEHRHAFGEDGAAREREAVLRQIAGGCAFGDDQAAVVEVSMPARTFSSVDLPVPLPPTRPMRSWGVISQSAFSKRSLWPKRFPAPESWIMGWNYRLTKTGLG